MKAFAETVAALGRPLFARGIGPVDSPRAMIARWKHGDARVQSNAIDAVRVCLSLRDGHTVRHGGGAATPITGGSVGVFAADRTSDVRIDGQADVLQVFADPAYLNEVAGCRLALEPSFDFHNAELQAAVLHLFLGARRGGPDDDLLMETSFWRVVEHLIARHVRNRPKRPRENMARDAVRRVDQLIADRWEVADVRAPSIGDLAEAARMSASHFIRVFKRSTGMTPHQYVLAHRVERAMGLLTRSECSVAEVADRTGYASPSHFVASFKQQMGMTPGTYRHAVLA